MLEISASQTNFWLLKLVPPGRWGRWLASGVIFPLILAPYLIMQGIAADTSVNGFDLDATLFFATLFAYIIPVHHLITQRSLTALEQLRPLFPTHPELISSSEKKILTRPIGWQITYAAVGLLAGIVHNLLILSDGGLERSLSQPGTVLNLIITTAIWIVMTATIAALVDNAIIFKRLSEQVEFSILDTKVLTPFGSVAASSTLALIGAQAAFPLLIVGSDSSWVSFLPGLIATGAAMIIIFLLPVIPMHRRIMRAKRTALAATATDLAPLLSTEQSDYAELAPLLTYRREVSAAPEWPFDTTVMGRLAIYLIIPPLTWVGAALIEILVDTAI